MLNIMHAECHKLAHYTDCCCAKCHFAERHGAFEIDTTMSLTKCRLMFCVCIKRRHQLFLLQKLQKIKQASWHASIRTLE
jgi:hypothetical protein